MKYQITYAKPNSSNALCTYKDTPGEAIALATQLRAAGYSVDVWEHTDAGARRIETDLEG